MITMLTIDEIDTVLARLPGWQHVSEREALHCRLTFSTFGEALAAMVRIGVEADKLDHHPEWTNVYGTIDIFLTTHDAGGVTNRDADLATSISIMYP